MPGSLEGAFQIATDVAKALPPPFDVTVPLVSTFGHLFAYFFPSPSPSPSPLDVSTLQAIFKTVLHQAFTSQKIENVTGDLNTLVNDFNSWTYQSTAPIPPSLAAGLNEPKYHHFALVYNNLYDYINGSAHGGQPALLTAINQMVTSATGDICTPNTNNQAAYLPTFALGVSTYLLFAKYLIAVGASAGVSPSDLAEYANVPIYNLNVASTSDRQGWINYAQAVSLSFQNLVAKRLSQVGPATPYFIYSNGKTFVYFRDSGEAVTGLDSSSLFVNLIVRGQPKASRHVFWPGDVPLDQADSFVHQKDVVFAALTDNSPSQTEAIAGLRDKYVALMQQTLFSNYFSPLDMENTIESWRDILTKNLQSLGTASRR